MSIFRIFLTFALLGSIPASAAINIIETSVLGQTVPDNNDVGVVDQIVINKPGIEEIINVDVELEFSGGWNGDLFAYLIYDSNTAVLLNRVGRDSGTPDGAGSSGMNITLSDSALNDDVHTALPTSGTDVSGMYQPDARTADPLTVVSGDNRTAYLSSFVGLDPNGTWSLFVADQSAGLESTLESWTLNITGIPEPSYAAVCFFCCSAFILRRRFKN